MPSGCATVPATEVPSSSGAWDAPGYALARWACQDAGHRSGEVAHPEQSGELVGGALDAVVDDGDVELGLGRELDARSGQAPLALLGCLGAAAQQPGDQGVPVGRREEDEAGPGEGPAHLPRSGEVDLQQHRVPLLDGPGHRGAGGAVAVPAVDDGPFQHLAGLDQAGELVLAHEVVVDAVDLTAPGRAGGGRDGQPDLRVARPDRGGDGPLADRGGTGQDRHRGRCLCGTGPDGIAHSEKCATSFCAWCEPRPRILREGEIPISSMICWALTLPTPGRASRRAETRRRPTISLVSASLSTLEISSPRRPALSFRRALMAARSRRASAAFFRASARCSGVRGGRATVLTSCSVARRSGSGRTPGVGRA